MGKVYDAKALFDVAKDRENAYDELLSQLGELKKALQGVADLEGSLEGKGADNIKSFYKQHADTAGQWENLIKMQKSYFSALHVKAEKAKLAGSTVVNESFLETELKNANSNAKEIVAQQHEDLQSILNGIDDIVSISAFSTSEFNDKIEEAEKKRTDTIEAVNQLDAEWSKEYSEMDDFYTVVDTLVSGLELATSQGGSAYQLAFNEKAYHDSELYKVQTKLNDYATSYVDYNKQQEEVYELEKKQEEEANKPWYEKTWDAVSTFTGEVSGYYDYKRAAEGVDPVTGEKLSTSQRVAAGAMAAAGFIPVVGWVGRAAKGGKAIYKTAKGLSAADHALDAYKSAKSFKVLEQTEKGLYGLVAANGLGEYMTGRDVFGNKISEEQRKASLLQALGIAGAGALSTKVAGKTAKAGANAVANGAKKLSDMRNVLSKQATQRIMPPLQSVQKAYHSSSNYVKKKISQAGDIKLAPKKVRVVEEPLTGTRMPVVDEWITGKDVGRMFSVGSKQTSKSDAKIITPKYKPGFDEHLIKVEGFSQKKGIIGGHNLEEFHSFLKKEGININIVSKTPHENIKGVYQIEYQIPARDSAGNAIDGEWKKKVFTKTVFNPSEISNEEIIKHGQEAMIEGIASGKIKPQVNSNDIINGKAGNGLSYTGYRDPTSEEILNFHPVIDE
ncbi:T7SS effector LXG polymorphic toxin [Priestia megaterium]|uniref:T7SS effector LXG polymorphic toxin n=1 Tax=Priestia megaterium TaxID=1404 RepID=UPI0036D8F961